MSPVGESTSARAARIVTALVQTSHPAPAVAVTSLTVALAHAAGVTVPISILLAVAVVSGQLVVGWSNDLIDRDRDRAVGRADKPLAVGTVGTRTVAGALAVAGAVCVVCSMVCGLAAGSIHLVLGVGAAMAYNLRLKSTLLSWVPYLVAFGALPVVVTLAADPARLPPAWTVVVAALLGVGAHLLNAVPDLADDAATGVHGLPHRLGPRRVPLVASVLLVGASVICVVASDPAWWRWAALAVVLVIVAASVRAPGRIPFHAAMLVAGVDAVMLVLG